MNTFYRWLDRDLLIAAGIVAIVICLTTGCTSQGDAERALRPLGYTDIQMTGYRIWSCSEDDTFHTGFRAKGANGQPVEGTVCSGIFKGATVRTD